MENPKNNNNSSLKAVIAVLAVLLIGSLVYIFKLSSDTDVVKTELTTTLTEKESVMKDLQELKATYDAAIAENTSMSDELIQERDKVVALMDDLNKSKGDVSKYRGQVQAMQGKMKTLVAENDELKKQNGVLTVMCGASSETFNFIQPVAMAFSRAVTLMGDVGAGQTTKMVNQICIAGLVQALSEGLAFAEKAGLDANLVLEVISKGAAQSWQMENRGKSMVANKFDFGFAVDLMRKDLGLVFEQANKIGAKVELTQLVDQFYSEVQAMGGNRWDTSSLIKRLK